MAYRLRTGAKVGLTALLISFVAVLAQCARETGPCPSRPVWMPPAGGPAKPPPFEDLGDLLRGSALVVAGDAVAIEFCRAPESTTLTYPWITIYQN